MHRARKGSVPQLQFYSILRDAFVGDKNFSVIKIHGTTIKIIFIYVGVTFAIHNAQFLSK